MAISQYYVDPAIAGNSGTGTIGDPYGDLQYALNTITRNATDGDQINIKAGTAEILAASLTLATYGTPTSAGPLILRGYTAAANDGGVGEINCGGFTMWTVNTYDNIALIDLHMHTFGNNDGVYLDDNITIINCTVHRGTSTPVGKYLIRADNAAKILRNYTYNCGDTGGCIFTTTGQDSIVAFNYVVPGAGTPTYGIRTANSDIIGNIVLCSTTGVTGIYCSGTTNLIHGNAIYNTAAGTVSGVNLVDAANGIASIVVNNIICGWSGIGGEAVNVAANAGLIGWNAFWNNTATYTVADQRFIDFSANDVALGADPFTNAAAGDFSLTAAAQAALRDVGWPAAYLGAHANTDAHITIGPIQYGPAPAASGMVSISPFRGNIG